MLRLFRLLGSGQWLRFAFCSPAVPTSLLAMSVVVGSLTPHAAWAQRDRFEAVATVPYEVEADRVEYEEERDLYELDGNVRVSQQGRVLTADYVIFSAQTNVGAALGNVVIRDGSDVVQAEFAWVNLAKVEILTRQATVDSAVPGFFLSGDEVEKLGTDTYRVQRGIFTTCRCPPKNKRRPWEITATAADVQVEGYAVARNVVFKTLGVPVLYSPLFVFPVKTQRQSGFLIPSIGGDSRGGTELRVPFFWAARENLNITLTPILLTKRGVKLDGEIEYVFGEEGYGQGGFAFLPGDNEIDDDDATERFSDDRFAFWLRHEQPLGRGTRFGLDLNRISDNQFVLDFDNFSRQIESARFLESSAFLTRFRDGMYTGIEASFLDDLQSPNDLDRDDVFLQRLPDIQVSFLPRSLSFGETALRAGLDFRYTYFYQKDDADQIRGNASVNDQFFDTGPDGLFDPDEPNAAGVFNGADNSFDNANFFATGGQGDGMFQPGEPIADRGSRVDVYPKLSLPRRFGDIETLSEVGYRDTLYFAEEAGTDHRGIFTLRLDARTRLSRTFSLGSLTLRHQVEPRVGFAVIDGEDQSGNPLFIPQATIRAERLIDADQRLLLRNPTDRIRDERFFNFGIANRLFAPPLAADGLPREVAQFRIGGGYDFLEGEPTNLFLDSRFQPNPGMVFTADLGYDPKRTRIEEALVGLTFFSLEDRRQNANEPSRRNFSSITYNYVRDREGVFESFIRDDDAFEEFERGLDRINQVSLTGNVVVSRRIDLFWGGFLSFEESSTRNGSLGFRFYSECACWQFVGQVQKRTRPDETRLMFELRLAGLGRQVGQGAGSGSFGSPF